MTLKKPKMTKDYTEVAQRLALEAMTRRECPSDIREFGKNHGIPEFARSVWEQAFMNGWKAAVSFLKEEGHTYTDFENALVIQRVANEVGVDMTINDAEEHALREWLTRWAEICRIDYDASMVQSTLSYIRQKRAEYNLRRQCGDNLDRYANDCL